MGENRGRDSEQGNHLYVSNLSYRTNESELDELFGRFGKVDYIKIIKDPSTKESRGFAFIAYIESEDADEAMKKLDREVLGGRSIHIEKARRQRAYSPTPGQYMGTYVKDKYQHRSPRRSSPRRSSPRRSRSRSPRRSRSPIEPQDREPGDFYYKRRYY